MDGPRMIRGSALPFAIILFLAPGRVAGQTPDDQMAVLPAPAPWEPAVRTAPELVAAGDSADPSLHPEVALALYREAIAIDSAFYPAWWKAGRALVDVGKQPLRNAPAARSYRDSLYFLARDYAERAIQLDGGDANGHYVLALALGRLSLTRGGRDRVRFGKIIYNE